MADANTVLALLSRHDSDQQCLAMSIPDLMWRMQLNPEHRNRRKKVAANLAVLMRDGLVEQIKSDCSAQAFGTPPPAVRYRITADGLAFVYGGKRIKSGPKGRFTGTKPAQPNSVRERAWAALHKMPGKRATVPDVVEMMRRPGDPDPDRMIENVRRYFTSLVRFGALIRLGKRAEGHAPTSNGFIRFAIKDGYGPQAPIIRKGELLNPNDGAQPSQRKAV